MRTGYLKWIVNIVARPAPVNDSRCEEILRRFSETEECPEDWPNDWKLDVAPLVRRASSVYRLSSLNWSKTICVKIINGRSQDAASLFAALRHYHARSDREKGFTVPQPYGWDPEYGAVIMEWVEGRTFNEILKREMFFTKRRHAAIRKVGGWLRWFHSQSEVEIGTFAKGRQLQGIAKVFNKPHDVAKAAGAHDSALREYLETAASSSGLLNDAEIDRAVLHGDFKPTNLLISPCGVAIGIDFNAEGKRGPVSHDICRFLSDLDLYRNALRPSFALSRNGRSNDFETFLEAYGPRPSGTRGQAFVYLYFLTILSAWVHQRRKFKRGARQRIRLAIVRNIAKQLAQELSQSRGRAIAKPQQGPSHKRPRIPIEWAAVFWQSDLFSTFL